MARRQTGVPLGGTIVKVDSVNSEGYGYASAASVTSANGSFELLVYRIPQLRSVPPDNEPATVDIKANTSQSADWTTPAARVLVSLLFAPMGAPVEPTIIDVQFEIP